MGRSKSEVDIQIRRKNYNKKHVEKLKSEKVYCQYCDKEYNKNSFIQHERSKNHLYRMILFTLFINQISF